MMRNLVKMFLLNILFILSLTVAACSLENGMNKGDCYLIGHAWDDGVVTAFATKDSEGELRYTCKACGVQQVEVIPIVKVANVDIYEINGVQYIDYGSYPQTHVGEGELIEILNNLTEVNERGYYEYSGLEFAKVITTPFQSSSIADEHYFLMYSDKLRVLNNVVEWFVVEPIRWRIISINEDGSYQIYTEHLLDATSFCDSDYIRNVDGVDVYRNNYKYSNVRAWMNSYNGTTYNVFDYSNKGFYDIAFTDLEKEAILIKEVNNGVTTTNSPSNQYICENTYDKFYVLSYQELITNNIFANDVDRYAQVTDYAKAVGAYWDVTEKYLDNNYYWLRTPSNLDSNKSYFITNEGKLLNYYTIHNHIGVRVACNIYIN